MKNESMGLTDMSVAALRSCVLHADGLARRIRDFFPVARNRKPLVDLSKVITCENIDEMLIFAPGAASNFWKTADVQVEQLTLKIGSPFGDW